MNAKPIFKKLSNPRGEATMNKKVIVGFFDLLAKRAKPTIIPPPSPQPIGHPKPM
jgi:hypothetical protein